MVSQLANAFEKEVLSPGDKVKLVVKSGRKEGTAMVCLKIECSESQSRPPLKDNIAELLEF